MTATNWNTVYFVDGSGKKFHNTSCVDSALYGVLSDYSKKLEYFTSQGENYQIFVNDCPLDFFSPQADEINSLTDEELLAELGL